MDKRSDQTAQEKLSNGTTSARRLLLATSLVGFLIATMPLSADTVSAFAISLETREGELEGIMIVALIYLVAGFMVRAFTDLAGAPFSPAEKRLREMIDSQTEDIKKLTMNSLANLLPSFNERKFHSPSFQSLLSDVTINAPTYREKMIDNTLEEIHSWKEEAFNWTAKNIPDTNQEMVPPKERIFEEYRPLLNELLETYAKSCRWRRWMNRPRWAACRTFVFLRYYFFDALAPSLFSIVVIVLLFGWIDETWILTFVRWLPS